MKIALLQLNYVVGDLAGNREKIAQGVSQARAEGADLAVCSELALTGYPPRDLLLRRHVVDGALAALYDLARQFADGPPLLVGVPEVADTPGIGLYNSAALVRDGKVERFFRKTLLPTYDVFDERRYFEPAPEGDGPYLFNLNGTTVGVTICEDVWNDTDFWKERRYVQDPVTRLVAYGAEAVVNLSSSPFSVGKHDVRLRMLKALACKHSVPVVYVNQVGGNDDLVFDGRSLMLNGTGGVVAEGKPFAEDVVVADLNGPETAAAGMCREEEVWNALVLGTRDYVLKSGFSKGLLGLSGGIDSAITAVIMADALGPEQVTSVMMPSPYSSAGSIDDSVELARKLGITAHTIPIEPMMQAFDGALVSVFGDAEKDVTEENIQSRIRGTLLMALSNKFGAMLLTTGNKSELSVGYCTIYGDMAGGLGVISDVPKILVYDLARWRNAQAGFDLIPQNIIDKAPSAELRPDQKDEDSLPPYEILDAILELYVEQKRSRDEILSRGYSEEDVDRVLWLVKGAEFKRKQTPPGLKITDRAFGTGWRMPIASKGI